MTVVSVAETLKQSVCDGSPEIRVLLTTGYVDGDEPIILYNSACVYAALGKSAEAMRCLDGAVGRGAISKEWVRNDPDLDPLRNEPGFARFVEEPAQVQGI